MTSCDDTSQKNVVVYRKFISYDELVNFEGEYLALRLHTHLDFL